MLVTCRQPAAASMLSSCTISAGEMHRVGKSQSHAHEIPGRVANVMPQISRLCAASARRAPLLAPTTKLLRLFRRLTPGLSRVVRLVDMDCTSIVLQKQQTAAARH